MKHFVSIESAGRGKSGLDVKGGKWGKSAAAEKLARADSKKPKK